MNDPVVDDEIIRLRRENARLRVLVHAAETLAHAGLDLSAVLDSMASRAAHDIGDWCLIRLISDDGAWLETVAARHHDPAADRVLSTVSQRVPHPVGRGLQGQVISSGQPLLVPEMRLQDLPVETRTAYATWYDRYGVSSLLIVPLRVDERVIGTLGLMRDEGGVTYTDDDRELALALADQAARAIATSRLHQRSQLAEARLRGILDGVADAVLISDDEGAYIDANPAAEALFGYSRDELTKMRIGDLSVTPATSSAWAWQEFRRLLDEGQWRGEATMRRKDGSTVPIEGIVTSVRLPDGSAVYVGSNRDISERRRLEQLQQDFIRMVSHDLRSPLTSIRGLSQLMLRRSVHDPEQLRQIIAQTDRMQSLLADLLDTEQIERGTFPLRREPVDLVEVLHSCVARIVAIGSRHDVRVDAPDRDVRGVWDRQRLEQVWENLLSNAIKYTPDGGQITVSIGRTNGEAVVSVHDTGIGIPPDAVPNLFTRFYRVDRDASQSPAGIGLGLYISRTLVEAMGGSITVESELGQGSVFTVILPIDPDVESM